jgi:tetratricopeptide (TPR) repeat protein
MKSERLLIGTIAAGLTVAALALGGVLRKSSASPALAEPASGAAAQQLEAGFSPGNTGATIGKLQAHLRLIPNDVQGLDLLGLAYQQAARETGDPAYYTKSGQVLDTALRLAPNAPDNLLALSGLGSLALSRHRFAEALVLGRRADKVSPTFVRNFGVIGDALVELGRYKAAFRAFNTMAAYQPGVNSYARVSHARDLLGNVPGAIRIAKLALDASLGLGEAEAWAHVQLGKLYWEIGRVADTGREDRAALRAFPDYPLALDALAHVQAAQGQWGAAIATEQEAVNRIPLPQYVSALGDMYRAVGKASLAQKQYATIAIIQRLLEANGVKTDLETAMFDADHMIRPKATLALARLAHSERPSIDGDDVLAWALERNGQCSQALVYSKQALRLGTRDALKMFHRGEIERCLGHMAAARTWFARALALNPHFSILWAPVAREALA